MYRFAPSETIMTVPVKIKKKYQSFSHKLSHQLEAPIEMYGIFNYGKTTSTDHVPIRSSGRAMIDLSFRPHHAYGGAHSRHYLACSVGWFISLLVHLCEREVLLAGSRK